MRSKCSRPCFVRVQQLRKAHHLPSPEPEPEYSKPLPFQKKHLSLLSTSAQLCLARQWSHQRAPLRCRRGSVARERGENANNQHDGIPVLFFVHFEENHQYFQNTNYSRRQMTKIHRSPRPLLLSFYPVIRIQKMKSTFASNGPNANRWT